MGQQELFKLTPNWKSIRLLLLSVSYKPERTDRKRQTIIQWTRNREWARTKKFNKWINQDLHRETSVLVSVLRNTEQKTAWFSSLWTVNLPLGFWPCHHSDCSWSSRSDRPGLLTSHCTELYLPENKPIYIYENFNYYASLQLEHLIFSTRVKENITIQQSWITKEKERDRQIDTLRK